MITMENSMKALIKDDLIDEEIAERRTGRQKKV
jgi:hypothetical protein